MHRRIVDVLLLLFLAAIGVNWPDLPYNARLADLIFIPLAALVVALPQSRWTWRWPDLAVAIYLLGAVPAIAVSTDRTQSAMEFVREIYLAVVYVVIAMAARYGMARTIGKGLALGGAVLAAAGLVFVIRQTIGASPWPPMGEVMPLPYIGDTLRLRALTASEAMLACVLTAAIPFAIVMCTGDRMRVWCATGAAMSAAAALTFSHAIAGFAVATVIAAWPLWKGRKFLRNLAASGAVVVFLALNFAATVAIRSITNGDSNYTDQTTYHYAVDQREMRIDDVIVTYNVMSYARIKQVAWRAFLEHPIAGIGLDQFHTATTRAYEEGALPLLYREIDPHSALLGRLAECGIIGGVTLLMLWGAWAAMARDGAGHYLGYAAAAAFAGLIVSSVNADIMNFRFLWVLAGLLRGLQDANGMLTTSGRGASGAAGTG
jgi:hypothetical protein